MWQPSRAQWWVIWPVALLIVLAWPMAQGSSLAIKGLGRLVDPLDTLPDLPPPLPLGLDDDGDAVSRHDAAERSYYDERDRSPLNRLRMAVKSTEDPFEPATERQLLIGLAVLALLGVWRLEGSRTRN
jgi:hypothetical protein